MSKKNNRKCVVCGQEYHYCPSCYEDRSMESWHVMFHDENCKNIFDILNKYYYGYMTVSEAYSKLQKCNLNIDLKEDVKKDIDKLKKNIKSETKIVKEKIKSSKEDMNSD